MSSQALKYFRPVPGEPDQLELVIAEGHEAHVYKINDDELAAMFREINRAAGNRLLRSFSQHARSDTGRMDGYQMHEGDAS